jgi:nucleotide-binding universal stress UspA family protein
VTRPVTVVAVGFDGSPESRNALRWAASLCNSLDASLKVIHAVGLLEEAHLATTPAPSELDVRRIASEGGLGADRMEWFLVDGSPVDVLLRVTKDPHNVDLLVVGSRGRGRSSGTVLGSTSLGVAERATVPVAIIPGA